MQYVFELVGLHLVESTVVGLALIVLLNVFRIKRASLRFSITRLVFLKFLLPVGVVVSFISTKNVIDPSIVGATLNNLVSSSAAFVLPETGVSPLLIGICIWILGSVFLFSRYGIEWMRSGSYFGRTLEGQGLQRVKMVLLDLGNEAALDSIRIDDTKTPIALVGIFRPRIVINNAFLNALSDNELRSALRHELEHWRRRDNLWRLLQVFTVCLFWFHPLLWYAYFRSCFESECACDEAAMNGGDARKEYAGCLLKATRFLSETEPLWVSTLTGNPLKRRIEEIVNFKNEKDSKMKLLSIWALIASLAVGSTLIATDYQSNSELVAQTEDKVYNLSEVNPKPGLLSLISPAYPAEFLEDKIKGWVDVEWIIDEDGGVLDARAVKSSHSEFENPSVDTISKSRWKPGMIEGKAVKVRVRQRLNFELPD